MSEADGNFGARLRARRQSCGLSQEELAERAGLNARTIRNLERGRARWPYRDTLQRLADALELRDTDRAEFLAAPGRRLAPANGTPLAAAIAPPRQLPAGVRHFTGRRAELSLLSALLDEPGGAAPMAAVPIAAISGTAGSGKSALAVHWAHQHAGQFPDGQLYADLRGFDPARPPLDAATVLRRFLDALSVPPARVPVSLDAQAALYRSTLASRRMLIVLDNARDAAQVRPLLPGAAGCMILITSRSQLTDLIALDGATLLTVGLLSTAEARELLGRRLGTDRVATEQPAADELIDLCGHLPLALNIAAAQAAATPARPLSTLTARLGPAHRRLDVLSAGTGRADVRTVFSGSYHALTAPAARLFRLLAAHPGPDFSLLAAASLAALDPIQTRRALDELTGAHLVTEPGPGRYALPDLLRAHAAEQPTSGGDAHERQEAVRRVLDHYLHASHAAAALHPTVCTPPRLTLTAPAPGVRQESMATPGHAAAWLATEHQVLIAVATQAAGRFDAHALRLPLLLRPYLCATGRWHTSLALGRLALAAARRLGDLAGQGQAHCYLGSTCRSLGDLTGSETHLRQALALYRQIEHHEGQGVAHTELAVLRQHQRRNTAALQHSRQALLQYQIAGCAPGEANGLNGVGWCHVVLGAPATGLPALEKAAAMLREIGDRLGLACTLDSLGYAYQRLGEHDSAITCYTDAVSLAGELGIRPLQAGMLDHLGDAQRSAAHPRAAHQAWLQAMDIYSGFDHHDVAGLRAKLVIA
jgi:transcriptional regulator with XRE-family HTH domain/tetratricopeptide (TPR) repeat protein